VAQAPDAQTRFGGLAVAGGTVYYAIPSEPVSPGGRTGLYAQPLAGGADTLISAAGQDPVAGDGVLLWQEAVPFPRPTPVPSVAVVRVLLIVVSRVIVVLPGGRRGDHAPSPARAS